MVLFDNLSMQNSKELIEKLKNAKISIYNIHDLPKTSESLYCVLSLEKDFLCEDAFGFIKNIDNNFNLKIILVSSNLKVSEISNSQFVLGWIKEISKTYNKKIEIIAEVDINDIDNIYQIITKNNKKNQTKEDNFVTIYTDGSCSGNPGPGGWGAILMSEGKMKEISGGENETTNNRMEILAVIKALEMLKKPCKVELFSDSAYVVNAFEQNWIGSWKANNWKNSSKSPVKNLDLWKILDNLTQIHEVHFNKVKGHADNEFNNRCDELAVMETNKIINGI